MKYLPAGYSSEGKILSAVQYEGTVTLVAGVAQIANTGVHSGTLVLLTLKTPGGTLGTHYSYTLSAGVSITITAVDTSGSTVTTDTSVISYIILN